MMSLFFGRPKFVPSQFRAKSGFSLIEMVMVVAILLALSYFAMPTLEIVYVKTREKQLRERLFEIRRGIDTYVAARNTTGGSPYPPSFGSLTATMPVSLLRVGAHAGPYLASESLGNPFKDKGDVFCWDVRRDNGTWLFNQTDPGAAVGVFDVRYPLAGVDGWKKAIDDTNYSDW